MITLRFIKNKRWEIFFIIIVFLGIILRFSGLFYGLPLWLVEDEPAFVTSALKMIELKTLIPGLHYNEFKGLLYYQPLFVYLLVPFFAITLGIKWLIYQGPDFNSFVYFLKSDLSIFFILARLIALTISSLSVLLIYKVAINVVSFKEQLSEKINEDIIKKVGVLSVVFFAFNLLHINFSFIGKEWMPTVFLFIASLYALSNPKWQFTKRYIISGICAGIAFAFGNAGGFIMPLILIWYLTMEGKGPIDAIKDKTLYKVLGIFILISTLFIFLSPFDFFIIGGERTITNSKTFIGAIMSIKEFMVPLFLSEPILVLFSIIGIIIATVKKTRYAIFILLFSLIYLLSFYLVFYYQHRYIMPLIPLFSITAGYGAVQFSNQIIKKYPAFNRAFIILLFLLLLTPSIKFAQVIKNNDARTQAIQWINNNLPGGTRIMTYADLTRLSSNKEAIETQETLDQKSLRQIDRAEKFFGKNPHSVKSFFAINAYSIDNKEFFQNLDKFAKQNDIEYILISLDDMPDAQKLNKFRELATNSGTLVKLFYDPAKIQPEKLLLRHVTTDNFGNVINLFRLNFGGQGVALYKLNK